MLQVTSHVGGSCTTSAISGLSTCKNAEDAMMQFCKHEIKPEPNRFNKGALKFYDMCAFYIFNAGEQDGGVYGAKWPTYGIDFANYIREHKLGVISDLPGRRNMRHHPTYDSYAWLWGPDPEALQAWYKERVKTDWVPIPWDFATAQKLVKDIQHGTRDYGYHLAMGGGVLNNLRSEKDLDLYFLPLDNKDYYVSPEGLLEWLKGMWGDYEDIQPELDPDYPDDNGESHYQYKVKFFTKLGRIDVFVI